MLLIAGRFKDLKIVELKTISSPCLRWPNILLSLIAEQNIKQESGTLILDWYLSHHNNAKILKKQSFMLFVYLPSYQIAFVFLKVHVLRFPKMYNSPYAVNGMVTLWVQQCHSGA